VNAITSMVAMGKRRAVALVVASERDHFTPCGACMDWIMQFGGGECAIGVSSNRTNLPIWYSANSLMPFYPR
jgi:cytidine deaminase